MLSELFSMTEEYDTQGNKREIKSKAEFMGGLLYICSCSSPACLVIQVIVLSSIRYPR